MREGRIKSRHAAAILGIHRDTLRHWRSKGYGPPYYKDPTDPYAECEYEEDEVRAFDAERKAALVRHENGKPSISCNDSSDPPITQRPGGRREEASL